MRPTCRSTGPATSSPPPPCGPATPPTTSNTWVASHPANCTRPAMATGGGGLLQQSKRRRHGQSVEQAAAAAARVAAALGSGPCPAALTRSTASGVQTRVRLVWHRRRARPDCRKGARRSVLVLALGAKLATARDCRQSQAADQDPQASRGAQRLSPCSCCWPLPKSTLRSAAETVGAGASNRHGCAEHDLSSARRPTSYLPHRAPPPDARFGLCRRRASLHVHCLPLYLRHSS